MTFQLTFLFLHANCGRHNNKTVGTPVFRKLWAPQAHNCRSHSLKILGATGLGKKNFLSSIKNVGATGLRGLGRNLASKL